MKLMVLHIGCLTMVSFAFDGTVNSLPCSVEDYVYDDDTTKVNKWVCWINNLFTEVSGGIT